jgi:NADH-quinone oxidoreductase subunit N
MLGGGEMNYIVGLRGLWKRNSLLGGIVVVNVLSMVGLPPFAGFFAKLGIIKAAIERGGIYIIIAIILVLIGVIGGYYYLRIIKIAIFEPSMERIEIMTGEGGIGIMIVLATTFMGIAC